MTICQCRKSKSGKFQFDGVFAVAYDKRDSKSYPFLVPLVGVEPTRYYYHRILDF